MRLLSPLFHQPKAVYLLASVEMWNRFSYYGMRALLMLFMLHEMHLATPVAMGIYAVFCTLMELGGVLGSHLADKFLGLRRSIVLGGWIVAFGHLCLAFDWFFPGLSLLIAGSSLFTTNITSLLGRFYSATDERRTRGFTLFYMGINIGALLATILCGFLAENYGWGYGFGLAALGMMIGNLLMYKFGYLLEGKGEAPPSSLKKKMIVAPLLMLAAGLSVLALLGQKYALPLLPFLAGGLGFVLINKLRKAKYNLKPLGLSLAALILFFAAEEQFGSSIIVYADQFMTHSLLGFSLSPSSILALNPMVIILFGAVASLLYNRLPNAFMRTVAPFLLTGAAFASIASFHFLTPMQPLAAMMGVVGIISFAELLIGPIAYSSCSQVATETRDSKVMGLVPIGFSLAATFGGGISKLIAYSGYNLGFLMLGAALVLGGVSLGLLQSKPQEAEDKL